MSSSRVPSSVMILSAAVNVHPSLAHVRMVAAMGPLTAPHLFLALARVVSALVIAVCRVLAGAHCSYHAVAYCVMGSSYSRAVRVPSADSCQPRAP